MSKVDDDSLRGWDWNERFESGQNVFICLHSESRKIRKPDCVEERKKKTPATVEVLRMT